MLEMKWQKAIQVVLAIFLLMPIVTTNQTLAQDDQTGDFRILLKSRDFTPPLGMGPAVEGKLKASTNERVHVLLQFWRIPTEEEKKALEDAGVQLLAYIPHKAWFASIPTDKTATEEILTPAQAEGMLAIRWIGDIEPADRIALGIRESGVGPWALNDDGTVNLKVTFFKDVALNEARQVIWAHDGTVLEESEAFNKLTVSMSATEIQSLAAEDAIQWIIEVPPPKVATNDGVRARIGVNTVQNPPYDLDGTNVDVGIWDGGYVDINHNDFAGRLTIGDSGGSTDDHATHVGGTVGGDGTLSASQGGTALQWRGMAPNVDIISYEWNNNLSEHSGAISTYGIELSQNSWGYEISRLMRNCYLYGSYTYDAPEYDDIVTGRFGKRIVVVFAAGNERADCDCRMSCTPPYVNYHNVGPPSTAKNIISVGATNSDDDSMTTFSSWGPMDDGRIKPDVVAPGCEAGGEGYIHSTLPGDTYGGLGWCGTSMAAPATSGSAALLYQQFRSTYTDTEPLPSTIKGLLIHTAVDLGNTGPDYGYGYGRIDIQAAVDTIRAQELAEDSVTQGATDTYTITVSAGATALKMTLVWDDEPGAENANLALVNDLDLVLVDPNGISHYPWVLDPSNPSNPATTGADHTNNVEQVYVSGPMEGAWEARVSGYSVPYAPQDYSLIGISGELIKPSGLIYYLPIILKSSLS